MTALSLLVPALRAVRIVRGLRVLRLARATRGLRLLRVVSSLNRGMSALGDSLSRRGFAYVVALTLLVTVAGAAGMYAFESPPTGGLTSYGEALWWTAMIMTTMGSAYWPQTVEGRVLCVFLSLYAFGVFGYVTATLATFFVGRDAETTRRPGCRPGHRRPPRRGLGAARRAAPVMKARLLRLTDVLRHSYWFVPTLMALLAMLLAGAMIALDTWAGHRGWTACRGSMRRIPGARGWCCRRSAGR